MTQQATVAMRAATTPRGVVTILPVIAATAGIWALAGDPLLDGAAAQILAGGVFLVAVTLVGVRRSRAATGAVDLFHPMVFPVAYVGFSFLAPLWLAFVMHQPLRGLARGIPIAADTTNLLVIGAVGFAVGASMRFRRRQPGHGRRNPKPVSARRLLVFGRILLTIPFVISLDRVFAGVVQHRGVGHLDITLSKTLSALLDPTEISAVVLIVVAHRMLRTKHLMAKLDWVLIGGLVLLIGARGSRGNAVALLLVLTFVEARRRAGVLAVVVGVSAMAVFGVVVLKYRSSEAGHTVTASSTDVLLGDVTVAAFSTGATAAVVPHGVPYSHGQTLLASLERQLPSPIANTLFGPPDDTAARKFREIIGFNNPNNGVGYSIPAEGYLNFGRFGDFGLCALLGVAFAWSYSRLDLLGGRVSGIIYPVFVAVLPFGLRSDTLGLVKSLLYAAILLQLGVVVARRSPKLRSRDGVRPSRRSRRARTIAFHPVRGSRHPVAHPSSIRVPGGRRGAEHLDEPNMVLGGTLQDQLDRRLTRRRRPRRRLGQESASKTPPQPWR